MLNGIQIKIEKEAKYFKQTLPNGNTGHGGNDDQYWENKNPNINHTRHEQYDVDIICKPNQKIPGQRMYQNRRKNNITFHHRIKTWIFEIHQLQV